MGQVLSVNKKKFLGGVSITEMTELYSVISIYIEIFYTSILVHTIANINNERHLYSIY